MLAGAFRRVRGFHVFQGSGRARRGRERKFTVDVGRDRLVGEDVRRQQYFAENIFYAI